MFENYVGPDDLQKGIRQYMRKHAWGAATARDFLARSPKRPEEL
jgi:aminopeptidase N